MVMELAIHLIEAHTCRGLENIAVCYAGWRELSGSENYHETHNSSISATKFESDRSIMRIGDFIVDVLCLINFEGADGQTSLGGHRNTHYI